ncbi:MAG: glycosyltransferase [Flavobacteriales bacterium]|nr:glycosyltransferase [Flavobacteriales bacterium]
MPRVLRILNRFNLGGPVWNASYLSADLSPEFETKLIGGHEEEGEESSLYIPESLGLKPQIVPNLRRSVDPTNDRRALKDIRNIIREFQPDIVHTHASKAGALGRIAAFKEKVPVVVHTFHGHVFHSYFHPAKTAVFKQLERRLARKSSAIIAISDMQKHELCNLHKVAPPDKTHVVHLGFDLDRFQQDQDFRRQSFRQQWRIKDDELIVAIIGRFAPVKNHELFFEAFAHMLESSEIKARAVVIGDGELNAQLTDFCAQRTLNSGESLDQYIIFTSWIKDISAVLPGVDLVALSSNNEGTPVSLIEAQAANVPVVATRVGGVENVIREGETGLIVAPGDVSAFSQSMQEILSNKELRKRFAQAGYAHAKANFSRERLANEVATLYRQLL